MITSSPPAWSTGPDDLSASVFRYGPSRTGEADVQVNPPHTLAWKRSLEGPSVFGYFTSSPVAMNDLLYLGAGGGVYALRLTTGETVWTYKTKAVVRSSPYIHGGILYIGANDGNLYAIDAGTGRKIWAFKTNGPVTSSPLVVEKTVYAGSEDGALYALDLDTGSLRWKLDTGVQVISSPAYAYNTIYFGSWDGYVYATDPDSGAIRWRYFTGNGVESTPAVAGGVLYIAASYSNTLLALDAYSGSKLWEFETGYKIVSSPAISDSLVFVGSTDTNIYAVDAETGVLRWKHALAGGIAGSSATVSGKILYVGSEDKQLYAFEKTSGLLIQTYGADDAVDSTPLLHDGALFFTAPTNTVYAFSDHVVQTSQGSNQSRSLETYEAGQIKNPTNGLTETLVALTAVAGLALLLWIRGKGERNMKESESRIKDPGAPFGESHPQNIEGGR